ncbi:hypothetical protein HNR46_000272 [Haloferula luteola]|uniref:Fibronectin type-III domain-containing protein n=1 Tax=Haloferula luteola TaxID=595692 RepID=A0A840VAX7_9BACT|nr:BNR-4 repeat-containing protein [Haloferula luteola]MBB5350051.1 hypothetical protein [Haloferula luteola]
MKFLRHATAAFLLAPFTPALAQLTYVDATDGTTGNTSLSDGGVLDASDTTGATTWRQRDSANFGASATVFEGVEPSPEICTRLTGLTPGQTYQVYVHFWDPQSTNEAWNIRAGFTSGSLTLFTREAAALTGSTASVLASSLSFDTAPDLLGPISGRENLAGLLGTRVADVNGEIAVYLDDYGSTDVNYRTWYDGLSYEAVPETYNITYVDASLTQTVRWDGSTFSPAAQGTTALDNNWELRTLGNSATVFESNADGAEDAPLLVSTLTGLKPDTDYVLYAYFWSDGRNWRLKASADASDIQDNGTPADLSDDFLPSSPLTNFAAIDTDGGTATIAPAAIALDFETSPLVTESNRTLRQASLGLATSNASGEISIFIDDLAAVGEPGRTWFDGLGYKQATPLDPEGDEDGDGLTNAQEETIGTDPYLVDTDGDTYGDQTEWLAGSDPLDPLSVPPLPGNALEISPDGAWTWFNDERAIFHQGSLFTGYVKSNGEYGVTRYDPATDTSYVMVVSTANSQQQDDHNNPSITVLPDGKLMVLYAKHLGGSQFYQRTSLVALPSSEADWGPEITHAVPANNTYNNTYLLSSESNRIYNFHRCINFNPTITISDDLGATWQTSVAFIEVGSGNVRPYPRYCSNHTDRIDLIYTDGHPRDVENSVYHMYYRAGGFYRTDGTLIDSFDNLPLDHEGGQRGSVIYQYSNDSWGENDGPNDWIPTGRGWTWDVHYGKDGNPVCVFQVQADDVTGTGWNHDRIYYYYARWTGTEWQKRFIAQGGRPIYSDEDDYGGGMTLDPEDPNIVYISSSAADPFALDSISDVPLSVNERFEIWRGVTSDGGLTFEWEAITQGSPADNLRPIVPENHGYDRSLVWFYGTYTTYTNFSAKVLAILNNGLAVSDFNKSPLATSATLKWDSSPGQSYRITGSDDLQSFPVGVAAGIPSQGPSTEHTFTIPSPLDTSTRAFFRVETEEP